MAAGRRDRHAVAVGGRDLQRPTYLAVGHPAGGGGQQRARASGLHRSPAASSRRRRRIASARPAPPTALDCPHRPWGYLAAPPWHRRAASAGHPVRRARVGRRPGHPCPTRRAPGRRPARVRCRARRHPRPGSGGPASGGAGQADWRPGLQAVAFDQVGDAVAVLVGSRSPSRNCRVCCSWFSGSTRMAPPDTTVSPCCPRTTSARTSDRAPWVPMNSEPSTSPSLGSVPCSGRRPCSNTPLGASQ